MKSSNVVFRILSFVLGLLVLSSCHASGESKKAPANSLESLITCLGLTGTQQYGNGSDLVIGYKNLSGKTIVAFQGSFSVTDDFGNVKFRIPVNAGSSTELWVSDSEKVPFQLSADQVIHFGLRQNDGQPDQFFALTDQYFQSLLQSGSYGAVDQKRVNSTFSITGIKFLDGSILK